MKKKIAVIGCGTLSESVYIPLLVKSEVFQLEYLIDSNQERLTYLCDKFGVSGSSASYRDIIGKVDAAIIVVPNAFHYPIAEELIRHGIHVLVEKPFALTTDECSALIKSAEKHQVKIAVGHVRRFYSNFEFIHQLVKNKTFGDVVSFELKEGYYPHAVFSNDTFINKEKSGGGVLMDIGPHVIDLLLWFFGDCKTFHYYDDKAGGVEAECFFKIQFENNIKGQVTISKVRQLSNTIKIVFQTATVEVGMTSNAKMKISCGDFFIENDLNLQSQKVRMAFDKQLSNFHEGIWKDAPLRVSGNEGLHCIQLIEQMYAQVEPLEKAYTHF
jgi:predicted dehydrogenase